MLNLHRATNRNLDNVNAPSSTPLKSVKDAFTAKATARYFTLLSSGHQHVLSDFCEHGSAVFRFIVVSFS
jgi:hypothetical protein